MVDRATCGAVTALICPPAARQEVSGMVGRWFAGEGVVLTNNAIEIGLARLSPEHREVLVLNAYCGYKFEEIVTMMGKRPEAIWMRASRARARLRAEVIALIGLRHAARLNDDPITAAGTPGTSANGGENLEEAE